MDNIITYFFSLNNTKKFIRKLENKLKKDYQNGKIQVHLNIPLNEINIRLSNTLILANHDAGGFDFMAICYYLSTIHNVEISVVANKFFKGKSTTTFLEDIAKDYNIPVIFTGSSTKKIIETLQTRSVLIFINPYSWKNLEKNTAIKNIITTTNCKPVYLKYNFNKINVNKININFITSEASGSIKYAIKVLNMLMQQHKNPVDICISISDNYDSYDDFIINKNYIKPIVVK